MPSVTFQAITIMAEWTLSFNMHSATMGTSLLEDNYKAYNVHTVLISPWIFFLEAHVFRKLITSYLTSLAL